MIDLKYSLVIEATEDPNFFGFYSPDLEGFMGIGHSIEDCLYKAKWGMDEHVALLKEDSWQKERQQIHYRKQGRICMWGRQGGVTENARTLRRFIAGG